MSMLEDLNEAEVKEICNQVTALPDSGGLVGLGTLLLDWQQLGVGRSTIRRGYRKVLEHTHPETARRHWCEDGQLSPAFLVIGTPKAGTTTLFDWISRHPRILTPPRKELQVLGSAELDLRCYRSYFPAVADSSGYVTGEATPSLVYNEAVASLVEQEFPSAKLILLRRESVSMAYSFYNMNRRLGSEHRTFEAAIAEEMERLGPTAPLDLDGVEPLDGPNYLRSAGLLPHLRRWLRVIDPERLLIIDTERLSSTPQATMDRVFDFIGLEPYSGIDFVRKNVGGYSDRISPVSRTRLTEWFRPLEIATEELLDSHPHTVRSLSPSTPAS